MDSLKNINYKYIIPPDSSHTSPDSSYKMNFWFKIYRNIIKNVSNEICKLKKIKKNYNIKIKQFHDIVSIRHSIDKII